MDEIHLLQSNSIRDAITPSLGMPHMSLLCCCCYMKLLCCLGVLLLTQSPLMVGLRHIVILFLLVRHRALLPRPLCQGQPRARMMCSCCCPCRCCAAALVLLLLCMCYCCAVLMLLLCVRQVSAADPREHGYCASQPFSVREADWWADESMARF